MTKEKAAHCKTIERVRHPARPSWGLGQILNYGADGSVRVFFEGAGERTFSLDYVKLVPVKGSAAQSTLLDNLLLDQTVEAIKFKSLPESVQFFLTEYPGGFRGKRLKEEEREYKLEAYELATTLLARGTLRKLLKSREHEEICIRSLRVVNATNLVFPNEKMQLKDSVKPSNNQAKFAVGLVQLLHGTAPFEVRFTGFANVLEEIDSAKWTIATYFPYITFPREHMFLKPKVTQQAAELCGFEISYQSILNWKTYDRLLAFSRWLFEELTRQGLKPRDMIDVQSFIWCIAPGKYE